MQANKIKELLTDSSVKQAATAGIGFVGHSGIIQGKNKNSYEQMKKRTKKLIDIFSN